MTDARELLQRYARDGSETAFRELVRRYLDLVHSVAFRRVGGDAHLARDVAQQVFTDLARKARAGEGSFGNGPTRLGGWLHRHACLVSSTLVRSEQRRRRRESQAAAMNLLEQAGEAKWQDLAPELDAAINELSAPDRDAILLRFYEKQDFRTVGAGLGISEDAAQKRVSRAVDKLRALLGVRGVSLSAAGLLGLMGEHAVEAAPVGLETAICEAALAGTTVAGGGLLGMLLRSLTTVRGGLAVGVALVAIVATPWLLQLGGVHRDAEAAEAGASQSSMDETRSAATSAGSPGEESGSADPATVASATTLTENELRLTIVTADTGNPVPNVEVKRRAWTLAGTFDEGTFRADRFGACRVPLEVGLGQLELTTHSEGLADTRLEWRLDRGETIPVEYTLRLDRAVPIGGLVVDADGQPVAGAWVGFSCEEERTLPSQLERHADLAGAKSGADGRWRINCLAEDVFPRLGGWAKHPDHLNSVGVVMGQDPQSERELRAEQFVFHLGRAITVHGTVVDEADQPVANASVLVGYFAEVSSRTGQTDGAGRFDIRGCSPGRRPVAAEAEGFAATTISAELVEDMEPVRLVLAVGATLRLRVVDSQGLPIEGATVAMASTWTFDYMDGKADLPPPQTGFRLTTDAEGRVVWKHAPDEEMPFHVFARGYQRQNDIRLRPDGQEHEIPLMPALVVEGTVVDAETREPVPQFRMICGYPERGSGEPRYVPIERFWLEFSGGEFHDTMEEAVIGGIPNPGYYFKFEAEGYASTVSRLVAPDEGVVRFAVRLKPAEEQTVTVLLPNGRPAAGVDIGLLAPNAGLVLTPSGFSRLRTRGLDCLRQTDEAGKFSLPSDDSVQGVIAAGTPGYVMVTRAALEADPVIRLAPWGGVSGVCTQQDRPVAGVLLGLESAVNPQTLSLDFERFQVRTDQAGRFDFQRVPPGLVRLAQREEDSSGGITSRPRRMLVVEAGKMEEIVLTEGVSLSVSPRWSKEPANAHPRVVMGFLESPKQQNPPPALEDPEALAAWARQPENRAILDTVGSHRLRQRPDGSWATDGVTPGSYLLRFEIRAQKDLRLVSKFEQPVTIPPAPPGGHVDLGEVVFQQAE